MWFFPPAFRVGSLVVGLVLVSGASSFVGYRLGKAAGDALVLKMLKAGQEVVAKRDAAILTNLEDYREKLAVLNARPPKRVFLGAECDLPPTPSGIAGPDPGVSDNRDYGPALRTALAALIRCNALIEVVK